MIRYIYNDVESSSYHCDEEYIKAKYQYTFYFERTIEKLFLIGEN